MHHLWTYLFGIPKRKTKKKGEKMRIQNNGTIFLMRTRSKDNKEKFRAYKSEKIAAEVKAALENTGLVVDIIPIIVS
jgi:hypothetical protein